MLFASRFFEVSTISVGLIGIGAIIGHGYPLFFHFKGGRAAGTLMGIYLFFIPKELLIAFVIIPLLVFSLIKKDRSFWTPFGIIVFSAVTSLFLDHTTDVKIMVCASGIVGLYFNRHFLPTRIKAFRRHG
jgi:glycerol-3-phosphate acyltransferase PlsY